nr:hypothetical protein [Paenarthrobacter nitroguajacolicus]
MRKNRSFAAQRSNEVQQFPAAFRVKGAGGLVKQKQPWGIDQRLSYSQPLAHSTGVLTDGLIDSAEPDKIQQLLRFGIQFKSVKPKQPAREMKRLPRVHPFIESGYIR